MLLAPSIPQVLDEFRPDGSARAFGPFCVTVYILGFVVGPLTLAPLSDLYGRLPLYRIYIVLYIVLTVACALAPSFEALIAFRFFAGCMGGAPMAMGRAVVADMYPPGDRVVPMASYSFGIIMAPAVGPIVGGIATGKMGWRWVFWISTILVRASIYSCLALRRARLDLHSGEKTDERNRHS
jgi:multidrug resistance protein